MSKELYYIVCTYLSNEKNRALFAQRISEKTVVLSVFSKCN